MDALEQHVTTRFLGLIVRAEAAVQQMVSAQVEAQTQLLLLSQRIETATEQQMRVTAALTESVRWLTAVEQRMLQIQTAEALAALPPELRAARSKN